MADPIECSWVNMYGSRPSISNFASKILERKDESGLETSYRGRVLLYASAEKEENPKTLRIPMMNSRANVDNLEPKKVEYALRVDVHEGTGFEVSSPSLHVPTLLLPAALRRTINLISRTLLSWNFPFRSASASRNTHLP